jgi:hypothetical protein
MLSLVRLSFAPALGKLLIALLSGERKRAPEVLAWGGGVVANQERASGEIAGTKRDPVCASMASQSSSHLQ